MELKVPARRVLSDDCAVYVGRRIAKGEIVEPGEPYYVHKGEWVEMIPLVSVAQSLAFTDLIGLNVKTSRGIKAATNKFNRLIDSLAERVVAWNWTDLAGIPLPCPYRNSDVLRRLTEDEIVYLTLACSGEPPGERKNASEPSPSTLPAEGRSRQKV